MLYSYPIGFLTLEMRYTGEDRESLLPYCYTYKRERKLGWTWSTDMVVEVMLEQWKPVFCFSVCSCQKMLKTGKDSKYSLYKRKLRIDLITVYKYFTWERDF